MFVHFFCLTKRNEPKKSQGPAAVMSTRPSGRGAKMQGLLSKSWENQLPSDLSYLYPMRLALFSLTILLVSACQQQNKTPFDYVDPFIGTGGHGHTYPGASMPFGMVQLSPDSRLEGWDGCGGYHYSDSILYGFSHTHLSGTGISDYADVLLMPTTGPLRLNNGSDGSDGYKSSFSHDREKAGPGYYSVFLDDYEIQVDLTVTERAGFHRYHFPSGENAQVVLDLAHRDKVLDFATELVDSVTIRGYRYSQQWAKEQRVHFYMRFSEPIQEVVYNEGLNLQAGLLFGKLDRPLLIKVGISAVDVEGAEKNLNAEIPHWDFERTKEESKVAWEKELNKIQVQGGSEEAKTIFYTSLYHSLLNPNLFADVDGRYLGMDKQVHQLEAGQSHYTVFSLWDTFRATHPLFTLIQQQRTNEFIKTFLRQYQQGGELPIWELAGNYTGTMIGYHAIPVIADAYVKGIRDYDAELALQAMVHSARQDKLGLSAYKSVGFIAADAESESVSKTLEYAYDDWCIAVMADSLGQSDIAAEFYTRAQSYKNLYDPGTGFMRAKRNNGWFKPFDPAEVNFNYTEANAWQYSLFVPQDVSGHVALMGGKVAYEQHLDNMFSASSETTGRDQADITGLIGQYAHGNEPSHHMAYLYSYIGKPEKTQKVVRQIMDEQYTVLPDGLSGNEDCGQMSSWYVLSAAGFYSVTPGTDYYVIGTPMFDKVDVNLENGKTFTVRSSGLSDKNIYIQGAQLNGTEYSKSFITHQDIMEGGELLLEMGAEPGDWGRGVEALPVSSIANNSLVPVPFFASLAQTFTDTLSVSIGSVLEAPIHYTLDGSEPTANSAIYKSPITLQNTTTIKAATFTDSGASKVIAATYYLIDGSRSIAVNSTYANQYAAAGDITLIDQLRGANNFKTGDWQGYREDLEVIIDLGERKQIRKLGLGVLQDINSWIWYPTQVDFSVSNDGQSFNLLSSVENQFTDTTYGSFVQDLVVDVPPTTTRYVKVNAKNYGVCPDWHLGAGGVTWIFADEVIIE